MASASAAMSVSASEARFGAIRGAARALWAAGRQWRRAALCLAVLGASGQALAQSADVLVNQTPQPSSIPAGGTVTYNITVTNAAGDTATGITLEDTLPSGAVFVSVTPPAGATCTPANPTTTFSCQLGSLAFNASAAVALVVRLPAAGVYNNMIKVTSATTDPLLDNNNNTRFATAVAAADLAMTATTSVPAAGIAAGAPYTYTLGVNNAGPNALPSGEAATVSFDVPVGAAITAVPSGSGWTCTPSNGYPLTAGTISCSRSDGVASGASFPDITVPAVANVYGTVTATFKVASAFPDAITTNNSAGVTIKTLPGTDMSVTKTVIPSGTVPLNQPLTYTITPRFEGGSAPASGSGEVIKVTDTLPSSMSNISATAPSPWQCGVSGRTVTCTYPGPYNGANFTNLPAITVTATPTVEANGVANTATVTVPNDTNTTNDSSTATVDVSNKADLALYKWPSLNPVSVNQTYNYTVRVSNNGPMPVAVGQTITVTESLPVGMSLLSDPSASGWTCNAGASFPRAGAFDLICTRSGPLGVGGSVDLSLPVANTMTPGPVNQACVGLSGTGPNDGVVGNNCNTAGTTTSTTQADLRITKAASGPVYVGENLTYTIQVTNAGPDPSTNVTVSDSLTNLLATGSVQSVTTTQGSCSPVPPVDASNVDLSCNLGTLNRGASATLTVVVRPANTTSTDLDRANTATVRSPDIGDPDQTNNVATANSTVRPRVDVTTSKSAPQTIHVGEPLLYTLNAYNIGPSAAASVEITDVLPANASFLSVGTPTGGGACNTVPAVGSTGATLKCQWAEIPPNTQYQVIVTLRPLPAAEGKNIVNSVSITTTTDEPVKTNNTASATTAVTASLADVTVTKVDTVDPIPLGTDTEYVITVSNLGPSYANNVVVTDTFPSGGTSGATFAYRGGLVLTPAGGSCVEPAVGATTGTLTCTFPSIDINQQITIRYRMQAAAIADAAAYSAVHYNSVTVKTQEADPEPKNNTAVENTTTRRDPVLNDLSVALVADKTKVIPGTSITYTMTVKNEGRNTQSGQVVFTVPAGLTLPASAVPATCTLAGDQLTCPVTSLAAGASLPFTLTLDVPATYTGGTALATAVVSAPDDQVSSNNNASVSLPPGTLDVDLSVALTADKSLVIPGMPITYTMTVKNESANTASGQVVFTVPAGFTLAGAAVPSNCTLAGDQLTCLITDLAPGASLPFTLKLDVPGTYNGGPAVATAVVSAPHDTVPGNNNASLTIPPAPPAAVPTLGEWALYLLMLLAAGMGMRQTRGRRC